MTNKIFRERNLEEKTGDFILNALEYPSFLEGENIKDDLFDDFEKVKTEELSNDLLPYYPFVTGLSYDGGSKVFLEFINDTCIYVSHGALIYQLNNLKNKESEENIII